ELVPPSARKPPVAPARAAATDVLLQNHDPEVGIRFGQEVGGPQTGETAADDDDVGVHVPGEGWAIGSGLRGQRLPQPPASLCPGRQRVTGEVEPGDRRFGRHRTSVATQGCARLKVVAPSTLFGLLEQGASDQPALVIPNRISLSYGRLQELADEAAHALASYAVGRGDRVAMVFPNGPEAVLLFLAASMVATACPLNAAYKE